MDFLIAGLQTIGRFHGHSYTLKELNPKKFQQIVNEIVKIRYPVNEKDRCPIYVENVNLRVSRLTLTLKSRTTIIDPDFVNKIIKLFEDCYTNVLVKSAKPREPLATIVHGDCTINNILFRRRTKDVADDGNDNGTLEGMLVDFAMIMYSSPATDVSTFLYMSASRHVVKERFRCVYNRHIRRLQQ